MSAERWYRLAMLAYPRRYRRLRADEIVAVLSEGAGQRPVVGEVVSLVRHGWARRMRTTWSREAWRPSAAAASVALAVVLGAAAAGQLVRLTVATLLSTDLPADPSLVLRVASWLLSVVVMVLVVRRRGRLAALGAWGAAVLLAAAVARALPPVSTWADPPTMRFLVGGYFSGGGNVALSADNVTAMGLVAAAAFSATLLSARRRVADGSEVLGRQVVVGSVVVGGLATVFLGTRPPLAVLVASVPLVVAMLVRGAGLRGPLLVAAAFCYLPFAGLVDGLGTNLPSGGWLLAYVAVLPPIVVLATAVAVRALENAPPWRSAARRTLVGLARLVPPD